MNTSALAFATAFPPYTETNAKVLRDSRGVTSSGWNGDLIQLAGSSTRSLIHGITNKNNNAL